MNDILRLINDRGLDLAEMKLTPAFLSELLLLVDEGAINITTAKSLLETVIESGRSPKQLVEERGLAQVSDERAIREICRKVVDANPDEVAAYREGKETLLGWFVGQIMRETRGKADAKLAGKILQELLKQ